MKDFPFRLAPLGAEHDRDEFCRGEEALDRYFKTQATRDSGASSRIASCRRDGDQSRLGLLHHRGGEHSLYRSSPGESEAPTRTLRVLNKAS